MNIESFVAEGRGHDRATSLLLELRSQQREKPEEKDCTGLIHNLLFVSGGNYYGTTFVEARDSTGKLCGVSVYSVHYLDFHIDFLCSDCPGTGREIINYIVKKASAEGMWKIGLTSVPRSVGFYEKVGFTRAPPEPGRESNKHYMELHIKRPPRAAPAAAGAGGPEGGRRRKTRRRKTRRQVKSRH